MKEAIPAAKFAAVEPAETGWAACSVATGAQTRRELGVDLAAAVGSGAGGAITAEDIEHAVAGKSAASAVVPGTATASKGLDLSAMRRVIAAAMARSKREIPHYYLASTIDMKNALDWLAAENGKRSGDQAFALFGIIDSRGGAGSAQRAGVQRLLDRRGI